LGEQALPLLCFYSRLNEMTPSSPASFEGEKKVTDAMGMRALAIFFFSYWMA
jgi:hypothetical protein